MKVRWMPLDETYTICRLAGDAALPAWATEVTEFISVSRSADELSVLLPLRLIPQGVRTAGEWRGLRIAGPLDFAEIGILAGLSDVLAGARISLFAVSTFDTDYLFVPASDFDRARSALTAAGHRLDDEEPHGK